MLFKTSDGRVLSEEDPALIEARGKVAEDWREMVYAIRDEDDYAPHVTEQVKDSQMERGLILADEIETGEHKMTFTIWQRINTELTGECVPFLPSPTGDRDA